MVADLRLLHAAFTEAAGPQLPHTRSPLAGYCGVVAQVVQGMFGGDIMAGRVDGVRHYWNRLPDGREVDLTSCQFGGDGVTPVTSGRKSPTRPSDLHPGPLVLIWALKVSRILAHPSVG